MERHQSPQAEMEEGAAEEADVTELKDCSVVLDRLWDDKAAKKELEEKEDMNRKGGKPVSRIPTFHKRPSTASQNPEPPVTKKDAPSEKAVGGSVDGAKPKPLDARETALPLPSIRGPRVFEAPPAEHGAAAIQVSQQSSPFMTVSPRPALRPEHGPEQHLPEQDERSTFETETDATPVAPSTPPPYEGSVIHEPPEDSDKNDDAAVESRMIPTDCGDSEKTLPLDEVRQEEAIMDEEPPWEAEPRNTLEMKDSRSSSDVDEDNVADEEFEVLDTLEVEDYIERAESSPTASNPAEHEAVTEDESAAPAAAETPAKAGSKSAKRPGRFSFRFFLLRVTLIVLAGFSLHLWRYGLPTSVPQLTAQLELHMLESFSYLPEPCSTDCRAHLVESIPVGLYPSSASSGGRTADSWLQLLDKANSSVHIAAFYLTLRGDDLGLTGSSDSQGRMVFEQLKRLQSRGVQLKMAVNAPQTSTRDTAELAASGAEVREVDLKAVTGGIVHTKLWVVDQTHLYLGSANMDWRSLSEVKELGLALTDCSCLAQDAFRIFEVYWSLGGATDGSLPLYWPARLSALYNSENPLNLKLNGVPAQVYLSSAPPQISARGRSDDLTSILSVIDDAHKFVYISVMDYLPLSEYTKPIRFWPAIDSALRAAACTRGVQVRLLVSCWKHSPAAMFTFLQSQLVLNRPPLKCNVEVKIFTVPSTAEQAQIPFARVNHAKYMVTDRVLYIGTSNWSENYFTQTAGVGLVVNQTGSEVKEGQETLQSQAEQVFLRDWTSEYASTLHVDNMDVCPH
ncbi:uncharacterized protein V6R79_018088 [Siganus canaliculatus]